MDPDLPLIRSLQDGEDSALNELIERHRQPLFRFVFRYLRDERAAQELTQEAFVRAYFKASTFEPRATVKTWLYAIALNLCRDHYRRAAKRRREISLDVSTSEGPAMQLADQALPPAEQAVQRDRFVLLQRAIDALPVALREAVVLCALEERSQKEAAVILGTTPKTVELRVYRAKERLRRMLGALVR